MILDGTSVQLFVSVIEEGTIAAAAERASVEHLNPAINRHRKTGH